MNFQISKCFKIIGGVKYLLYFFVGCYFIYQGDVLTKYNIKRTSFSQYDESITELPTILTRVMYKDNRTWSYENDFSISFGLLSSHEYHKLNYGENDINGMIIHFEQLKNQPFSESHINTFRITLLNSPSKSNLVFHLLWALKNTSDHHAKVWLFAKVQAIKSRKGWSRE